MNAKKIIQSELKKLKKEKTIKNWAISEDQKREWKTIRIWINGDMIFSTQFESFEEAWDCLLYMIVRGGIMSNIGYD